MTTPTRYRGQPVSEGISTGEIYLGDAPGEADRAQPPPTRTTCGAAFVAVARQRAVLACLLRERGQDLEAGIVDIGALIAVTRSVGPAIDAVRAGAHGIAAVSAAAEAQATVLAALPDPDLAQRAGDVREVAAAVVDHLRGNTAPPPPAGTFILLRHEVDPADLIQLADSGLVGAVSVAGGASSHAAIIARGPRPAHAGLLLPPGWPRRPGTRRSWTPARGHRSSTRTRKPSLTSLRRAA